MKLHRSYLIILTLILMTVSSPGRTIDWGGGVNDDIVDSSGNLLDDSYIFELGSFGSFTPSELNLDEWLTNWKVFDRATAPAGNGWNSSTSFLSSIATMEADGTTSETSLPQIVFNAGEQGYIWVYNSSLISPTSEWALITNDSSDGNSTDDWLFPSHSDQTNLPLEWRFSTGSTPSFGGLNDEQGPGSYSVDPVTYDLQTHTVPEPSGMLLASLAAAVGLFRRRR